MTNYITILVLIFTLLPAMSYANFFEQRYRGWLWFEEGPNEDLHQRKNVTIPIRL